MRASPRGDEAPHSRPKAASLKAAVRYGGGLRRPGTFIERCKTFIDELNADHSRGAIAMSAVSKTTFSIHFYDSAAVFEGGQHIKKHAPVIGRPI
jgi:hypothetical protein